MTKMALKNTKARTTKSSEHRESQRRDIHDVRNGGRVGGSNKPP